MEHTLRTQMVVGVYGTFVTSFDFFFCLLILNSRKFLRLNLLTHQFGPHFFSVTSFGETRKTETLAFSQELIIIFQLYFWSTCNLLNLQDRIFTLSSLPSINSIGNLILLFGISVMLLVFPQMIDFLLWLKFNVMVQIILYWSFKCISPAQMNPCSGFGICS